MPSLLIDCDYNSGLAILPGPDYIVTTTGGLSIGTDSGPVGVRGIFRFPMDDLPAGATITLAEVRLTQWQNVNGSDREQYYGPYNSNGLANPASDAGSVQAARSNLVATNYLTTTTHQADGQKSVDITSGAAAHIAAAAGATYTAVVQQTDETTDATKLFRVYGQSQEGELTPPDHIPQLYIEYTEAASSNNQLFWRWRN